MLWVEILGCKNNVEVSRKDDTNDNAVFFRLFSDFPQWSKPKRRGERKRNGNLKNKRSQIQQGLEIQDVMDQGELINKDRNVVNIFSFILTAAQILSKGLSFCPCSRTDWFQLELDLEQLCVWFDSQVSPNPNTDAGKISVFDLKGLSLNN